MVEQILGFACACIDFVHLLEFYTQIILFINLLIYFFFQNMDFSFWNLHCFFNKLKLRKNQERCHLVDNRFQTYCR